LRGREGWGVKKVEVRKILEKMKDTFFEMLD